MVLVVEDEIALRGLMRSVFSITAIVLDAASGGEALAVWEQLGKIDLLVTDIVLPDRGRHELAGMRKQKPRLKIVHTS
jgi:CheY-like chemotaxis protein